MCPNVSATLIAAEVKNGRNGRMIPLTRKVGVMSAVRSHNAVPEPRDDSSGGNAQRALRADAEHNRERILNAARELVRRDGIDVPLATIARRAGVGVATLYRRFPTRNDLIAAVYAEQRQRCIDVLHASMRDPDAWRGLCSLISTVCSIQAVDQGFNGILATQLPDAIDAKHDDYLFALDSLDQLVSAAHAQRRLRLGVTGTDVLLIVLANSAVVGGDRRRSLAASRRLVAHLLAGIGAPETLVSLPTEDIVLDDLVRERLG